MSGQPIRVLVVEDDPVAADAHVLYVDRVPGFVAVGKAHTGAEARRALERTPSTCSSSTSTCPTCTAFSWPAPCARPATTPTSSR
ncbi:hypothetical protein SHKM778_17960 [Streptomyces sp. KM77-8]|uniref:Response regulator n=1 Tax=Streptomyces haneummycinicus TaxID=3074435 RepID=A0AAT9HDB3_9ACTN